MLTFSVLCVGTLKESWLREAQAEYVKRIAPPFRVRIEEKKKRTELPPALGARAFRIALCVEGSPLSSEALDIRPLARALCTAFSGKGGGPRDMAQGRLSCGTEEEIAQWIKAKAMGLGQQALGHKP